MANIVIIQIKMHNRSHLRVHLKTIKLLLKSLLTLNRPRWHCFCLPFIDNDAFLKSRSMCCLSHLCYAFNISVYALKHNERDLVNITKTNSLKGWIY